MSVDGSSQRSDYAFMAKMSLTWFYKYPSLAVQELNTVPNYAYLNATENFPRIILHKHFIYPRTHKIIPATQVYLLHAPQTKYSSPVAQEKSVCWTKQLSKPLLSKELLHGQLVLLSLDSCILRYDLILCVRFCILLIKDNLEIMHASNLCWCPLCNTSF